MGNNGQWFLRVFWGCHGIACGNNIDLAGALSSITCGSLRCARLQAARTFWQDSCRALSSDWRGPGGSWRRLVWTPVHTEHSVRSENAGVPTIREIMVATTMRSLFVALFALVASSFRIRAALQAEILALRHQLAVCQKSDDEKTPNHDSSAVSKLQIGNGLVRISPGMVEILVHSCKQRQDSSELQSV